MSRANEILKMFEGHHGGKGEWEDGLSGGKYFINGKHVGTIEDMGRYWEVYDVVKGKVVTEAPNFEAASIAAEETFG